MPEAKPAAVRPVPFGDEPHQTLHPALAERILRLMWAEARPLFGYFLNQAMGVEPKPPTAAQRAGAPDLQGRRP
jgi:hypothetical protein